MRKIKYNPVFRTAFLLPLGLILAGWLGGAALEQPYWRVEASYPVWENGEMNWLSLTWRFEVREIRADAFGPAWCVSVSDEEGIAGLMAEFLFYPREGRIRSVQTWKYFRRQWIDWPVMSSVQDGFYLQDGGFIPLDFVARAEAVARQTAAKAPAPLRFDRLLDSHTRLYSEFQVMVRPAGASTSGQVLEAGRMRDYPASRVVQIRGPQYQPQVREVVWGDDLPWWLECHTPAYSARLVEWAAGDCDE